MQFQHQDTGLGEGLILATKFTLGTHVGITLGIQVALGILQLENKDLGSQGVKLETPESPSLGKPAWAVQGSEPHRSHAQQAKAFWAVRNFSVTLCGSHESNIH